MAFLLFSFGFLSTSDEIIKENWEKENFPVRGTCEDEIASLKAKPILRRWKSVIAIFHAFVPRIFPQHSSVQDEKQGNDA